jgi:hypothetical protein
MRRRLSILSVATALAGCSMPNPQWTASDVGGDPTTTTDETASSSQGGTSVAETTTTTSDITTEPTTGSTSTTDPTVTASATSDATTTSTTDPSTTSTTTGEELCENWEFDESGAFKLKLDEWPGEDPEFPEPNCGEVAFTWVGSPEYGVDPNDPARALVTVTPAVPCGGFEGAPIAISGLLPEGYKPVGGACVRVKAFLRTDPENANACTAVAGFELTDYINQQQLYLGVSSGRIGLTEGLSDYVEAQTPAACVDNGGGCGDPLAGIHDLGHKLTELSYVPEGTWEDGGALTYHFFNGRSHTHGSESDQPCAHHLDWLVRRAL